MVIIDASFALPLLIPGPKTAQHKSAMDYFGANGLVVTAPSLWTYEVTSTIQKLWHFKQLATNVVNIALSNLHVFSINLVAPTNQIMRDAIAWSRQLQRANAYDSFYLALARAYQCDLWTADQKLVNAVNAPWVRSV